jgi:uncharacterized protein (TIGR02594 family)
MATPLGIAQTYSGTREGDQLLDKFLNDGGKGLSSAEYAWCSRFMQRTAAAAGYDVGSANDMARSWLNVGEKVDKPQAGDVAVFPRGSNQSLGHVGYVQGVNPDGTISLLSGNDGDQVRTSTRNMSEALGFRRLAPRDGGTAVAGIGGNATAGETPVIPQLASLFGLKLPGMGDAPAAPAADPAAAPAAQQGGIPLGGGFSLGGLPNGQSPAPKAGLAPDPMGGMGQEQQAMPDMSRLMAVLQQRRRFG